jgi:threonyl-tRNA synthetase
LREETVGYKIRDAISRKIPYVSVIGEKEIADTTVSVRKRGENKSVSMAIGDFLELIHQETDRKE